jgi:hypothetical protein
VVSVPLLNRLIIIASPYITINDNTSGIPISIYPSMTCLELDRITERMRTKSLKNLDQNSFLTAIPDDNFPKKVWEMQIGMRSLSDNSLILLWDYMGLHLGLQQESPSHR